MTAGALWFRNSDGTFTVKAPAEVRTAVLDLSGLLAILDAQGNVVSYTTISGTPSVTVAPTDMTVTAPTAVSGYGGSSTAAAWEIAKGSAGNYMFTVTATGADGRVVVQTVWLRCGVR